MCNPPTWTLKNIEPFLSNDVNFQQHRTVTCQFLRFLLNMDMAWWSMQHMKHRHRSPLPLSINKTLTFSRNWEQRKTAVTGHLYLFPSIKPWSSQEIRNRGRRQWQVSLPLSHRQSNTYYFSMTNYNCLLVFQWKCIVLQTPKYFLWCKKKKKTMAFSLKRKSGNFNSCTNNK
jgi:hypothetical protein